MPTYTKQHPKQTDNAKIHNRTAICEREYLENKRRGGNGRKKTNQGKSTGNILSFDAPRWALSVGMPMVTHVIQTVDK
jgi:hypothetical protein